MAFRDWRGPRVYIGGKTLELRYFGGGVTYGSKLLVLVEPDEVVEHATQELIREADERIEAQERKRSGSRSSKLADEVTEQRGGVPNHSLEVAEPPGDLAGVLPRVPGWNELRTEARRLAVVLGLKAAHEILGLLEQLLERHETSPFVEADTSTIGGGGPAGVAGAPSPPRVRAGSA